MFPEAPPKVTKREMLRFLSSIYDPLGLVSPVFLLGKFLYQEVCDQHFPWDQSVPENIRRQWKKFQKKSPRPPSIPVQLSRLARNYWRNRFTRVWRHKWGRISSCGICGGSPSFRHQQRIAGSKIVLGKKGLTGISICAHGSKPCRECQKRPGSAYKQFVAKQANKIRDKEYIQ